MSEILEFYGLIDKAEIYKYCVESYVVGQIKQAKDIFNSFETVDLYDFMSILNGGIIIESRKVIDFFELLLMQRINKIDTGNTSFTTYVLFGEDAENHFFNNEEITSEVIDGCIKREFQTEAEQKAYMQGLEDLNGHLTYNYLTKEDYNKIQDA